LKDLLRAKRVVALTTIFYLLAAVLTQAFAVAACCGETGMSGAPDPLPFGLVKVGKPSKEEVVTFTASKNIKIGTPTFPSSEPQFKEGSKDTCKGKKLAATGTCEIGVIFTPSKIGREIGFLKLAYEIEATKCTPEESIKLEGAGE
jgi:hypothetical protein